MVKEEKKKRNPFGMVKREISTQRMEKLHLSLQYMSVMSELIKTEYRTEMDVDFKDPFANNLCNRIGNDCIDLAIRLRNNPNAKIKVDTDFLEEYSEELHRVFKFFIGMPVAQITELMDGWEVIQDHAKDHEYLEYVSMGLTDLELVEIGGLANRKGVSLGLKQKLTALIEDTKNRNNNLAI